MPEKVTIIGAGITGLATALILSDEYTVTILARDQPGDYGYAWASPWAGAAFHPQKDCSPQQQEMQIVSFKYYWELARREPKSGVKVYRMTEYWDDRETEEGVWYRSTMPDWQVVAREELPSGCTCGVRYNTVAMNPDILLPWLKEQLLARGVKFARKELKSIEEARELTGARLVVNASGVGARELAGDYSVGPVRGQTMFVKTDFSELVMKDGSEYTYVIPRVGSGGVIMGGIKSDRIDTDVDVELKSDILARVNRVTRNAFTDVDLNSVKDIVGFRPGREAGLRVEKEGDVVHAYGAVGAGYIYSFGVAMRVRGLLKEPYMKACL